jgi:hypothetical protein
MSYVKKCKSKEGYDKDSPVCNNQDDFNQALKNAIQYNNKEAVKRAEPWMTVCALIWLIFFVWALVLAMKLPHGSQKVQHIMFAILFSPAYVLANYISEFNRNGASNVQTSYSYNRNI